MIKRVTVKYLKRFAKQTFDLADHIVLAGPNNSGKSTLLQAVMVWNLAMRQWLDKRGAESKAEQMHPDEVVSEVKSKLNSIAGAFGLL